MKEIQTVISVLHVELQRGIPLRGQCRFVGKRSLFGVAVLARNPCVWGPTICDVCRGGWQQKVARFNDHDGEALDFPVRAYPLLAVLHLYMSLVLLVVKALVGPVHPLGPKAWCVVRARRVVVSMASLVVLGRGQGAVNVRVRALALHGSG